MGIRDEAFREVTSNEWIQCSDANHAKSLPAAAAAAAASLSRTSTPLWTSDAESSVAKRSILTAMGASTAASLPESPAGCKGQVAQRAPLAPLHTNSASEFEPPLLCEK